MIAEFVASWALFRDAYLAGLAIAGLLSLVGVVVIARGQVFVGAAISQASALGIAGALALVGGVGAAGVDADLFAAFCAVVFSIAAALLAGTSRAGEERTGWIFLVGASFSTLVLAHSPHGLEEIHRLIASSVIGAGPADVALFSALAAVSALALAAFSRRILLVATDPGLAEALRLSPGAWSIALALWLGLAVGLSIRASGVLYAFGCLVLPPLVATHVCRELRSLFVVSPLIGLGAAALGFVAANHYDLPPAQLVVAILTTLLALAWLAALRPSAAQPG